jgi:putative membrane protein
LDDWVHYLPTANATLNATATVLLVWGYVLIKLRRETAHKRVMLTAFAVSIAFLICYLIYHKMVGHVVFQGPPNARAFYYVILCSHIPLAFTVPVLACITIYLGYRDRRARHKRWAKWTFPIWLYVSITGVMIYVMLYHLYPAADYPPAAEHLIIEELPLAAGESP